MTVITTPQKPRIEVRQSGARWVAWCTCGCRGRVGSWSRTGLQQRIATMHEQHIQPAPNPQPQQARWKDIHA